jgi:hypothetical protein
VDNDIHVIVSFDIVEADIARKISLGCQIIGRFGQMGRGRKGDNGAPSKSWCENVGDIL